MEKDICKYCNSERLIEKAVPPHIGLYCGECGRFQRWAKQSHNIETGEVATDDQQKYALDLLRQWKQANVRMTKRQAGAIIQAFRKQEG
jgi:hypothetical protein